MVKKTIVHIRTLHDEVFGVAFVSKFWAEEYVVVRIGIHSAVL